jgi:hypothetical protein
MSTQPKRTRRAIALGALLVCTLAVVALGPLGVAGAQDSSSAPAKPPALSSTQKQCLLARGLTALQDNSGQPISLALVQSLRQEAQDAAKTCGVTLPSNALGKATEKLSKLGITLDQVQCVLSKGVPLPSVGAGQRPTAASLQTLRQELVAAAQACDITVPAALAGGTSI